MHWREPLGTAIGTASLIAWVALSGLLATAGSLLFPQSEIAVWAIFGVTAIMAGAGGLYIFWLTADAIAFWIRGCRLRWPGPAQISYEERAPDGEIRVLLFVYRPLGDGYRPPCEVQIPREEHWDSQMPSWARGRRQEIVQRLDQCFGGEYSKARFVDPPVVS